MQRVIPGVSIAVVKEVVPKPLRPAGVMGLVGLAGEALELEEGKWVSKGGSRTPFHVDNWKGLCGEFGTAVAYTMPEARQAILNGIFELVIVRVIGGQKASRNIGGTDNPITLKARAEGKWGNDISVQVEEGAQDTRSITLRYKDTVEKFSNLVFQSGQPKHLPDVINQHSTLVMVEVSGTPVLPKAQEAKLTGGADPSKKAYKDAIGLLEKEADVDMVLASMPDSFYGNGTADEINSEVQAHCERMSDEASNRIGFGSISFTQNEDVSAISGKAAVLNSDRFVMVAPHGVVGAVAGLIASLPYYESPTFKNLVGVAKLEFDYVPSDLRKLLNTNVLPVDRHRERGFIVVKGITTSGEQISVTRVADHAVKGVKSIASLFIGKLNTEDGRLTLKQKITEFFIQMERENAIVPSVDGVEPAFKIEVYSSGRDFALGVVRIDIAVRPVRAIDYIYVTIFVQV